MTDSPTQNAPSPAAYDAGNTVQRAQDSAQAITSRGLKPGDICSLVDIPEGTLMDDASVQQLMRTPPILMHGGPFFGIRPTRFENAFTRHNLHVNQRMPDADGIEHYPEADMEARALAAMYRLNGHSVVFMLPQPNALDGIFCTDSDKSFQALTRQQDGRWRFGHTVSILPTFTHIARQPEVPWKEQMLRTTQNNPNHHAQRIIKQMLFPMEFGDTRIVLHQTPGSETGFVLAGIAESNEIAIGRSTREGHMEFEALLKEHVSPEINVITIHLRQPFYHMDTSGPPCSGGHMFTTPAAFLPESWELLQHLFGDKLVELPLEDVRDGFAGNATCFGTCIYMSNAVSDATVQIITERGYDVCLTPIPHTMKGGGGHRCMTSSNPHYYMEGGYNSAHDESRSGSVQEAAIDYTNRRITLRNRGADGQYSTADDITDMVSECYDSGAI